jgi:hypothetical protein
MSFKFADWDLMRLGDCEYSTKLAINGLSEERVTENADVQEILAIRLGIPISCGAPEFPILSRLPELVSGIIKGGNAEVFRPLGFLERAFQRRDQARQHYQAPGLPRTTG